MSELIFKTIHGSRLYGLDNETSDQDIFRVTNSWAPRVNHNFNVETRVDTATVGLDRFLELVFEGSHQSVEALFSPYKVWGYSEAGIIWRDYLEGLRITGPAVFGKYERTIKKFCFGDFKRRRHACRLQLNLHGLRIEGRFNPVMKESERRWATDLATNNEGDELWQTLTGIRL